MEGKFTLRLSRNHRPCRRKRAFAHAFPYEARKSGAKRHCHAHTEDNRKQFQRQFSFHSFGWRGAILSSKISLPHLQKGNGSRLFRISQKQAHQLCAHPFRSRLGFYKKRSLFVRLQRSALFFKRFQKSHRHVAHRISAKAGIGSRIRNTPSAPNGSRGHFITFILCLICFQIFHPPFLRAAVSIQFRSYRKDIR